MLYDDMMTLDMGLCFKVNGSFGSLANVKNSDMLDMKPTVISSVNTRSLLLGMFSFKFWCKFLYLFSLYVRDFSMFDSWHTLSSSTTTSVWFEMTISRRDASWNISFIEPNIDEGESTYIVWSLEMLEAIQFAIISRMVLCRVVYLLRAVYDEQFERVWRFVCDLLMLHNEQWGLPIM